MRHDPPRTERPTPPRTDRGTELCSPNSAQKYATGRSTKPGYDAANQVPADVAVRAVAALTAS